MYDPTREAREFVGQSQAEALSKAKAFFGVGEEELATAQPPAGEIFGLGTRVVFVAYPKSAGPPRRGESGASAEPRRGRERRDDDRPRGRGGRDGRDRDRRPRDGGRGPRDRGDRGDRGERGERDARGPERES